MLKLVLITMLKSFNIFAEKAWVYAIVSGHIGYICYLPIAYYITLLLQYLSKAKKCTLASTQG